jgi:hypothetical protein
MLQYLEQGDIFNAQSMAYMAKSMLHKALHQFKVMPKMPPEIQKKYPGVRAWSKEEMFAHLRSTPYPGYFPQPWDVSRFGKKDYYNNLGCDPSKNKCQNSYYEEFMKWGPPQGTYGVGLAYDPRLDRNMDKYQNIWGHRATKFRMSKNIPSPHVYSPGTGPWMDVNNLPEGKRFLDEEDKQEYFRLLDLYNKFKKEEKARGTSYIAPPSAVQVVASKFARHYPL